MEMTFFDKIALIFKYILSSFMTIEISVLCLLLFVFVFLNFKINDKKVKVATIICFLAFLIVILFYYSSYILDALRMIVKAILQCIYFPTMPLYFIIMIGVTISLIYSIISKSMDKRIKRINIIVSCIEYLLFILVISICVTNKINLKVDEMIYQNSYILALVQTGNIILFLYIEGLLLYRLYTFFQKKFD